MAGSFHRKSLIRWAFYGTTPSTIPCAYSMTVVENLRWRCPMTRLAVFYLVCLLAALVAAVWIARAFLVSN